MPVVDVDLGPGGKTKSISFQLLLEVQLAIMNSSTE